MAIKKKLITAKTTSRRMKAPSMSEKEFLIFLGTLPQSKIKKTKVLQREITSLGTSLSRRYAG